MAQLHDLTALEQAAALRRGEVTSAELVAHYLERIERHDSALGAFITVSPDQALAGAAAADERLAATDPDDLPPLFGVPTGIKDLHPTAGIRTTFASLAFADYVPDADGAVVGLLRAAGMPVLGKTNTPEFGVATYTANGLAGEARTPFDLTRSASGSSGGAAASVAAGLLPVAHASDAGGSIRMPAAACGVVGFKPSRGVVSPPGPAWLSMSTEGPIARTVADAAALLDLMARPASGDLYPTPPRAETYLQAIGRSPGRLRIARFLDTGHDTGHDTGFGCAPDAAAERAYHEASALLADLGHDVVSVDNPLPPGPDGGLRGDLLIQLAAMVAVVLPTVPPQARAGLQHYTRYLVELIDGHSMTDLAVAQTRLAGRTSLALTRMSPFDAVLTPTTPGPPLVCGSLRNEADAAEEFERMGAWSAYAVIANLTGQPSVSLPLHHTDDGLPVGVMLTGRRNGDAELLALAAQLEAAAPWQHRRPGVWST